MSLADGTVLADRYRIVDRIGSGGMGEVYRGYDHGLEREVAIKVLAEHSDDVNRRFLAEAQAMARLNHPNIVAVHDVGMDGDVSYIIMEYVRGATIRSVMNAEPPSASIAAKRGPDPGGDDHAQAEDARTRSWTAPARWDAAILNRDDL